MLHTAFMYFFFFFFFNDPATTEIYTLSLHDALPILSMALCLLLRLFVFRLLRLKRFSTLTLKVLNLFSRDRKSGSAGMPRPISYAVFCLKKKKTRMDGPTPHAIRTRTPSGGGSAARHACARRKS